MSSELTMAQPFINHSLVCRFELVFLFIYVFFSSCGASRRRTFGVVVHGIFFTANVT